MIDALSKLEIAEAGIRRIIGKAVDPTAEWNPERDKLMAGVLVEAENILRELDGKKELR